jgi:hypothetical protein
MLSEKFFLYLEALVRNLKYADGSPRVQSTSAHVPCESAMRLDLGTRDRPTNIGPTAEPMP